MYVVCELRLLGHECVSRGNFSKAMDWWNRDLSSYSEETKKGKVFGILSQLKKLIKYNDVQAQNKTFLISTWGVTIAAENSRYRRWRYYGYSLMGSYVY